MPITQKQVDELKAIYKKHKGKELSNADAWAMAHRLINLVRILSETDPKPDKKHGSNPTTI